MASITKIEFNGAKTRMQDLEAAFAADPTNTELASQVETFRAEFKLMSQTYAKQISRRIAIDKKVKAKGSKTPQAEN